ncbi:MAG: hypothetical protein ACRD4Y_08425, partial [Candidatus Acidiferrales bacterium]
LELAVSDIQLFGTPEQVQLAQKFAADLATTQGASIDKLLNELRDSLRRELGRKPVTGNVVSIKVDRR